MNFVFFGTKKSMSEAYLGDTRIPVTQIIPLSMSVAQQKTLEKDGYEATSVKLTKSKTREIPSLIDQKPGDTVSPLDTVKAGCTVSVHGTTKGKGFAGVVKRWNFAGGFKTHGQPDRHRAPGSIGQGTTPGRVHKGKKMAGRMGGDSLTLKNLLVVAVDDHSLWVKGPIPGTSNTLLRLTVTSTGDAPNLTYLKGFSLPTPPTNTKPAPETPDSPPESPAPTPEALEPSPEKPTPEKSEPASKTPEATPEPTPEVAASTPEPTTSPTPEKEPDSTPVKETVT